MIDAGPGPVPLWLLAAAGALGLGLLLLGSHGSVSRYAGTAAATVNEAFSLTGKGLVARPLLYGLVAFSRTLGPGAKLVRVRLEAPRSLQLKAWAVRVKENRLRVLLIDKGERPVRAVLCLPATGRASVQRLRAPSVGSRFGVTFDGRRLGVDGRWHGARGRETVVPGRRGYAVTVPRRSAALVSVHVAGH